MEEKQVKLALLICTKRRQAGHAYTISMNNSGLGSLHAKMLRMRTDQEY